MPSIDLTLIGLPDFLKPRNKISDEEAITLYKLWASSPPGQDIIAEGAAVRSLIAKGLLRQKGMQEGASRFALTAEGRIILIEMVTNLPSMLKQEAELPKLSKIRSRAKRARQTFVKKAELEGQPQVVVKIEGFDAP
jgi:hypothetical protein